MARSIWRGAITFGLISIPIKLYTAVGREGEERIDTHLLHAKDGERVRYDRVCEKGHRDLDWSEIVKGYEYQKGKWVELTDEDLEALDLPSMHTIDVQSFAPAEQIDPIYFDSTYYVVPDEAGTKAYRLMTRAMEEEGLVGVAKVAIREREHLSTLRVSDGVMVLETMHWPEEVREPSFDELKGRASVQDRERRMARQLIQQLAQDFDPSRFKDEYHAALKKLIRKKVKGEDIVRPEAPEEPSTVMDLMEALRASVDAAKRGEKPKLARAAARTRAGNGKARREDLAALSRAELEDRAKELGVQGRSKMDKKELAAAIRKAS
jgi:DNA end-binding protein Ku